MEKALQRRLQMDDFVFQEFWTKYGPFKFKGSIALVWDYKRPWHPKTKQEIYSLLSVTRRLGVWLPRLVIELIATFNQQQELFQDLDADIIEIKLVSEKLSKHQRDILAKLIYQRPGLSQYYSDLCASDEAYFVPIIFHDAKIWPRWREWCQYLVNKWDRYRIVSPVRHRFAKLLDDANQIPS